MRGLYTYLRVRSYHLSQVNTSRIATTAWMARKKPRADSSSAQSSPMTGRRRSTLRDLQASADNDVIVPKVINAAPSLQKAEMYGIDDQRPTSSKVMAMAGRIFIETIPQWLAVGGMLALIFGGCCSNVSAGWVRGVMVEG